MTPEIPKRHRLPVFLLLTGILLIQFYVGSSGGLQPSYLILFLFCVSSFFKLKKQKPYSSKAIRRFVYFFLYALFVNLFYGIWTSDYSGLNATKFLVYSLLLFYCFYHYSAQNPEVITKTTFTLGIGLVISLIVSLLGLGRHNFGFRYNGFFNDPNQMAFWVLCSCACFVLYSKHLLLSISAVAISTYLILLTASRSGTIGLVCILLGIAVRNWNYVFSSTKRTITFLLLGTVLIIAVFILTSRPSIISPPDILQKDSMTGKLLSRFNEIEDGDQLKVRGYDLIWLHPEYLFTGYGQRDLEEFGRVNEIHSTWAGILFYYGIIGLSLFLSVIWSITKHLKTYSLLYFMAPLLYSFSTYGARTPIFYVFLALFALYPQYLQYEKLNFSKKLVV